MIQEIFNKLKYMFFKLKDYSISLVVMFMLAIFLIPLSTFAVEITTSDNQKTFVVSLGEKESDIVEHLYTEKIIKSKDTFKLILDIAKLHDKIKPGGYKIANNLNEIQVIGILISEPSMKWVVIPEGYRKEQIAEVLAKELGWKEKQKMDWIFNITESKADYAEGVYFPDTYLIPVNETGEQISKRMINRFNEKFSYYQNEFSENDIKWTTALKIASIVQREAASKEDMPLIAGVIWNRLSENMRLEIDATVQYIKDFNSHINTNVCKKEDTLLWKNGLCFKSSLIKDPFLYVSGNDWWKPITVSDEKINSPYNSYLSDGLPPRPISNPGINAIDAVLSPAVTDCLFYLHDNSKKIHCAKTYEEHLKNIDMYLK